jgi:hypothetical protein
MAEPSLISTTTVVSLASTVALLGAAYGASLALLPKHATTKTRIIYIWHLFDALTHFVLEGIATPCPLDPALTPKAPSSTTPSSPPPQSHPPPSPPFTATMPAPTARCTRLRRSRCSGKNTRVRTSGGGYPTWG